MLWAYFDESGEHDQSGALMRLTIGGGIAPFEEWEALSIRWSALLRGSVRISVCGAFSVPPTIGQTTVGDG